MLLGAALSSGEGALLLPALLCTCSVRSDLQRLHGPRPIPLRGTFRVRGFVLGVHR